MFLSPIAAHVLSHIQCLLPLYVAILLAPCSRRHAIPGTSAVLYSMRGLIALEQTFRNQTDGTWCVTTIFPEA